MVKHPVLENILPRVTPQNAATVQASNREAKVWLTGHVPPVPFPGLGPCATNVILKHHGAATKSSVSLVAKILVRTQDVP